MSRSAPASALFPYTTLFRSGRRRQRDPRPRPHEEADEEDRVGREEPAEGARAHAGRGSFAAAPPARFGGGPIQSSSAAGGSEEHTSELQSPVQLACRLLLET